MQLIMSCCDLVIFLIVVLKCKWSFNYIIELNNLTNRCGNLAIHQVEFRLPERSRSIFLDRFGWQFSLWQNTTVSIQMPSADFRILLTSWELTVLKQQMLATQGKYFCDATICTYQNNCVETCTQPSKPHTGTLLSGVTSQGKGKPISHCHRELLVWASQWK